MFPNQAERPLSSNTAAGSCCTMPDSRMLWIEKEMQQNKRGGRVHVAGIVWACHNQLPGIFSLASLLPCCAVCHSMS